MSDTVKFIKMLTTIPEDFVDSFYSFYDEDSAESTDLIINLETVAKWLGCTRVRLVSTLRKSKYYKHGVDYVMSDASTVLVTPNCFKHLAMTSTTKQGYMVRCYFIEINDAFVKYRRQTLNGIEMHARQLVRGSQQKRKRIYGNVCT
jgi:hypothetical protein